MKTPTDWEEKGSELLEENFQKGECKERGDAMVLFAHLTMLHESILEEALKSREKELIEKVEVALSYNTDEETKKEKSALCLRRYPIKIEPMNKELCYCGHPKERHECFAVTHKHRVVELSFSGCENECLHCSCRQFALNEEPQEGESESKVSSSYTTQDAIEYHEKYIVLERPKDLTIGQSILQFSKWVGTIKLDNEYFYLFDEQLLKLWQEWLSSLKK